MKYLYCKTNGRYVSCFEISRRRNIQAYWTHSKDYAVASEDVVVMSSVLMLLRRNTKQEYEWVD